MKDLYKRGFLLKYDVSVKRFLSSVTIMVGVIAVLFGIIVSRHVGVPAPFFAGILILVFLPMLTPRPKPKTKKGSEVLAKIKGLDRFLRVGNKYQILLQDQNKIFEGLLPYAIAFNATSRWERLVKSHVSNTRVAPNWFVGKDTYGIEISEFLLRVNSFCDAANNATSKLFSVDLDRFAYLR